MMGETFSFVEDVQIYDTDAQGVVHYSGYYRFFTDAMHEFVKSKGYKFPFIDDKHWFVVLESNAKYLNSAKVGDTLDINLTVNSVSKKIIRFDFDIKRGQEQICQGYVLHICIDKDKWKSADIPDNILNELTK
jgi:acyl-CoA thioester hydrolase